MTERRPHAGHVLATSAFVAPLIAVFASTGLAVLLPACALCAAVAQYGEKRRWPSLQIAPSILFALLLLWCALSAFWSIDPASTLGKLPRLTAIIVAGLVVIDVVRRLEAERLRAAESAFLAGFGLALLLLLTERLTHAPIRLFLQPYVADPLLVWSSFNRGVAVMALMVWPAALVLWRRTPLAGIALWTASLAVIALYISNAAVLALAAGAVAFLLVRLFPRGATVTLAALLAAFILASPLLFGKMLSRDEIVEMRPSLPRSGYHRLLIWNFTAEHVFQRPLWGWGFNTSRSLPGAAKKLDRYEEAMPLHPHNGALQIWLELGLPGALLAAALAGGLVLSVREDAPSATASAAMAGAVFAVATIACLSYGIWQSWWVSAIWLSAMLAAIAWRGAAIGRDGAPARP